MPMMKRSLANFRAEENQTHAINPGIRIQGGNSNDGCQVGAKGSTTRTNEMSRAGHYRRLQNTHRWQG